MCRQKSTRSTWESQYSPFDAGQTPVSSTLSEPHQIEGSSSSQPLLKKLKATIQEKASSMFVSLVQNRRMILNDRELTCLLDSQPTGLSQISEVASTGNAKGCCKFWTEQCQEASKKLWLPQETDCVVSPLSCSSGFFKKQGLDSLSSNQRIAPQKMSSLTTSCQSFRYSAAGEMEKEGTVTVARKTKLKLTREQKKKLRTFADHARFTYNAAVEEINKTGKGNKMKLRNQLVTYKDNPYFEGKEWLVETPKVIRQQAVFEATKNFKSALTNLTRQHIKHFKLGFKTRKKQTWALGIERAAKKIDTGDKKKRLLSILPETLGQCGYYGDLPFEGQVTADSSIQKDNRGRYFLVVPIVRKKRNDTDIATKPTLALDPGVRKFLTGFASDNSALILGQGFGKRLLRMLQAVDLVDSEMSKANCVQKKKLRKKKMLMLGRIKELRDEFQWKTINYLTSEFSCIILPHLQTQPLSQQQSRTKIANREMLALGHYQFFERLKHKCRERNVAFVSITEHYTSKTCTKCGELTNVGSSERYVCQMCGFCADRDINAARNIFLKSINESCLHMSP